MRNNLIAISGKLGSGKDTVANMIRELTRPITGRQALAPDFKMVPAKGNSEFIIKRFAGKLKEIVSLLTGIPLQRLELQEVKDSELPKEWHYWAITHTFNGASMGVPLGKYLTKSAAETAELEMRRTYQWSKDLIPEFILVKPTVRWLLQTLGTDGMRDVIHPNIHVNALFADYKHINCECDGPGFCGSPGNCETLGVYPKWLIPDLRFKNEAQAIEDRGGIILRVNRVKPLLAANPAEMVQAQEALKKAIVNQHPSECDLDEFPFPYVIHNNGTISDLLSSVEEFCRKVGLK